MKKIFVFLSFVIVAVASMAAMNLTEAFKALSNLPSIGIKAPDFNYPVTADVIKDGEIAAAYNLDSLQIKSTGDAVYAILNQVPLSYMINGGNNNEVAAFIYSTPNDKGSNDILMVIMSGYRGSVVCVYGTVSNADRNSIQAAPLEMQNSYLRIEADIPGVEEFNIILNKAR